MRTRYRRGEVLVTASMTGGIEYAPPSPRQNPRRYTGTPRGFSRSYGWMRISSPWVWRTSASVRA